MKGKFLAFVNRRYARSFGVVVCGNSALPAVDFNYCAPEVRLSEGQRVFIAKASAAPFNDWTQPLEWITRLSQDTTSGDDYIRALTVIGDKPLPTDTTKEVSAGRTVILKKDHIYNFTVDEATALNHEFMRNFEDGEYVRLWYEIAGGLLFGGNSGIYCFLSGGMLLQRGQNNELQYQYQAKWKKAQTEERCISPIFDQTETEQDAYDTTITVADITPITHNSATFTGAAGHTGAAFKFKFKDITDIFGTPISMTIKVSGVEFLLVDTTTDFLGRSWTYTDGTTTWSGVFADGIVNV